MRAVKSVLPVAGLGTRFLPATKSVPKEMFPLVDRPAIEYVVDEACRAGLRDCLLVTGRNKRAIEDHFDRNAELERVLALKGDEERLRRVVASQQLADLHYVRQQQPKGLGHAVLCAAGHVGQEPFAVLLGDDLIDPAELLLESMLDVQEARGGSVIALMRVPEEQVGMYGCASVRPGGDSVLIVDDLVEKPDPAVAPSDLAVVGRYVLEPAVFEVLRNTPAGRGNEVQLTDALAAMARGEVPGAGPVHAVVFEGNRFDTGNSQDYLKAAVQIACTRDDFGDEFRDWLHAFSAEMRASRTPQAV